MFYQTRHSHHSCAALLAVTFLLSGIERRLFCPFGNGSCLLSLASCCPSRNRKSCKECERHNYWHRLLKHSKEKEMESDIGGRLP